MVDSEWSGRAKIAAKTWSCEAGCCRTPIRSPSNVTVHGRPMAGAGYKCGALRWPGSRVLGGEIEGKVGTTALIRTAGRRSVRSALSSCGGCSADGVGRCDDEQNSGFMSCLCDAIDRGSEYAMGARVEVPGLRLDCPAQAPAAIDAQTRYADNAPKCPGKVPRGNRGGACACLSVRWASAPSALGVFTVT